MMDRVNHAIDLLQRTATRTARDRSRTCSALY
jgi:hypothetical protein